MEMTGRTIPVGALGLGLAVSGLIAYSLLPDKFWLVTLLEALALACLIWFFARHFEQLKSFSGQRSTRMGANSALMVTLFIAILAIINFLGARHSTRWDFSENQNYTLAPETYRVLRNLTRDVSVTVFTREKDPGYQAYKERFDSYNQASSKLTVQFIDPERQPKVAQNYGITRTDIAIFESGPQSVRITSPAEVTNIMRRAFTHLRNGRLRPVLVEMPWDVLAEDIDGPIDYTPVVRTRSAPDPAAVREAAKALVAAKRPVIHAGQGVHWAEAYAELRALARPGACD